MKQFVAVIPALNPQEQLLEYVQQLYTQGIESIVVVNDGSDEKYDWIFKKLDEKSFCQVLTNEKNEGKGYSLKKGFQYVYSNYKTTCKGILTVGAHGQHRLKDVGLILRMTKVFSNSIVLGVRNLRSSDVKVSQYIGNRVISSLFKILFNRRLLDTQSGLRFIPLVELPWLLEVKGNDFDYDTNMLVEAIERRCPIYEVEIGSLRVKKNTILRYDEVMSIKEVIKQMRAQSSRRKDKLKKK